MKLRPYQTKCADRVYQCWEDGFKSTLVVKPTGTGKTVTIAEIIRRNSPKRAMVVAHREELIWQAKQKIESITGLVASVEMGSNKSHENDLLGGKPSVIVSSIQTQTAGGDGAGRMGKFDPAEFGMLVIDEAHHATSPSYRKVIDYYSTNPDLVILGVTATPDRADEQALGQIFDSVAFNYELLDAIKDGWLVPIEQQMVSVQDLDFSAVRTTAGDLNGADLAEVMEAENPLHGIASASIDIADDKRGLGFASSVNHARMLCEIFNRHKPGMAAWVCGKTDKDERRKIVRDFADGKIQWLWNCGVFTEGFDDCGVEVISVGRPTKSRSLYAQMIGRGTRPADSIAHKLNLCPNIAPVRRAMIAHSIKPSILVIDFVGNSGKHKLMTSADVLGGEISDEALESAIDFTRKSGGPVRMDKLLEDEESKAEEARKRRLAEEARKARLIGKATYKTQTIDPFQILDLKPVKHRGWDDKKVLSEGQKNVLRKAGINPDAMEYARARQLVTTIIERWNTNKCTLKQAATLEKFGITPHEASAMTFQQASLTLDAIAKNNWRRPAVLPKFEVVAEQPANGGLESDDVPF